MIGRCHQRHRAVEFRKFLDTIEAEVPADLDVHLIADNYATHKTALIRNWFAKRPRFHMHFTPTSASWLNLVERWFGLLTEKQLRRGVHQSRAELETAIYRYLDVTNEDPKPFVWTKTADQILANVAHFCQRTLNTGHLGQRMESRDLPRLSRAAERADHRHQLGQRRTRAPGGKKPRNSQTIARQRTSTQRRER